MPPGKPPGKPPAEPNWLPLETVVAFNRKIVVAAANRMSCATAPRWKRRLAHPWNVWVYFMDHDFAVLAARLYTGLAEASAFAAGNKRTAYRAAVAFANGFAIDLAATATRSTSCSNSSPAASAIAASSMVSHVDGAETGSGVTGEKSQHP